MQRCDLHTYPYPTQLGNLNLWVTVEGDTYYPDYGPISLDFYPAAPATIQILYSGLAETGDGQNPLTLRNILNLEVYEATEVRVKDDFGNPVANADVNFTAGNYGRVMDFVARWCCDNAGQDFSCADRSEDSLNICYDYCADTDNTCPAPGAWQSTEFPVLLNGTTCDEAAWGSYVQCQSLTVLSGSTGLAKAEWIFGPLPDDSVYNQGINLGPFPQSLTITAGAVSQVIPAQALDIPIAGTEVRAYLHSTALIELEAGNLIPEPLVAYLFYRHDELYEPEAWPLERVAPQWGTTIAANFAVRYYVKEGGGTVGANPWQAPSDGATVEIWLANEGDARTEAWWRLGCNSGSQELWVVGLKEVWGASERSARSWYWPIAAPLPDYCVEQGSITIVDENGNELQYLAESTDLDPQVFYVKQVPPQLLTGGTYTGPIEGELKSFYYGGDVLDSLTIDLVYDNYGGESYHRAGPFEAVYVWEVGETPSAPGAAVIYAMRGAPIVADPQGVGSNAVPNYVAVFVDKIFFNWDPEDTFYDAITLKKNLLDYVRVPEFFLDSSTIEPAAYLPGRLRSLHPQIKATFTVIPSDALVYVQPVSARCGEYYYMPTCFPPMNFQYLPWDEEQVPFVFQADLPERVVAFEDSLYWKVSVMGGGTVEAFPFITGPHEVFVTYAEPLPPMEEPWEDVLRMSTIFGSGCEDEFCLRDWEAAMLYYQAWQGGGIQHGGEVRWVDSIKGINRNAKIIYRGDRTFFSDYDIAVTKLYYNLPHLLEFLREGNPEIEADCHDVNGFYGILLKSQGIEPELEHLAFAGTKTTRSIFPIGYKRTWPVQMYWDTHFVSSLFQVDELIWDATLAVPQGGIDFIPTGWLENDYQSWVFEDLEYWNSNGLPNIEIKEDVP